MKKTTLLLPLFLMLAFSAFSQENGNYHPLLEDDAVHKNNTADADTSKVYDIFNIEKMPNFPGGDDALLSYISGHVTYPQSSLDSNIQGRVTVAFTIGRDGSVSDVHIKRGISADGGACNAESVRVVKSLPKFSPGLMGGIPVKVAYSVPITFKIKSR